MVGRPKINDRNKDSHDIIKCNLCCHDLNMTKTKILTDGLDLDPKPKGQIKVGLAKL